MGSRKAARTLVVVDEYFPQTSAPAVRLRSFVKAATGRQVRVVGGCERTCKDPVLVPVSRPDERRALAFIWFLIRMNAAAIWQVVKFRPRVTVVSIPKYELLFSFPLLRLLCRVLVLDVRDSIDFIDYGAYFSHVMPRGLARVVGGLIGGLMRGWFWLCTKLASVVTVANEGIAKKVKGSVVVENGVDTDLFRPYEGTATKGVHVMYVGNFAEKDRFDLLVSALRDRPALATVHLAGRGRNKDRVLRMFEGAGIPFVDHGVVDHERLPEVMGRMDAGFLFRDEDVSESIPVAFYEFVSVGVPVIANPVGIMQEFVRRNEVGWVVESDDGLREALSECRAWRAQKRRLHDLAKKRFSRGMHARRFWKVIGERS